MIKYNKTQYGQAIIILLIAMLVIGYILYKENQIFVFGMIAFLLLIILNFYKLTIIIKDKTIIASLGIGLLKRKVKINDIDFSTLEKVNYTLKSGIGVRWTSKGWLWNVQLGDAIYFKTKNKRTFLVGTEDYETIVNILKQH